MAFIISPNMNLIIPGVGTEDGPLYATDVNNSLTIIDQHNHTAGSGVLITPAAININADLPMNNNSITNSKGLNLSAQSGTQPNSTVYRSGVDLHYVDNNGVDIQLTAGGTVNATSSGISSGTASASFVAGVLVVNAAALTPANIQAASYLMGNNTPSTFYLTLQPPAAMAANYSLTFPTLPSQTNVMTLDTAGNMGSITYNDVANNRTRPVANSAILGGIAIGGPTGIITYSGGTISGATTQCNLQTSGNSVYIGLISDGLPSYLGVDAGASVQGLATFYFFRNGIQIAQNELRIQGNNFNLLSNIPCSAFSFIDTTAAAGSYTYDLRCSVANPATNIANIINMKIIAYEL